MCSSDLVFMWLHTDKKKCNHMNTNQIAAIRGAVNGLMREVIKGHLTEHIVHQGDELKREEDLDVVLKVLDSYIK